MVRRLAWLLPALILAALAGLGIAYRDRAAELDRTAPEKPALLPAEIISQGGKWEWVNNEDKPRTRIRASGFKEIRNPPSVDLQGLELIINDKDGKKYNLITSDSARFSKDDRTLFAEGVVKMTLGIPLEGPRPERLLEIETSGVRFEMDTNKAMSEKDVRFRFGAGSGQAVGAEYDPNTEEIRLRANVTLHWADEKDAARAMRVEAGEALYKPSESKVFLSPWSKLRRGTLSLEGGAAQVLLDQGVVRHVDAEKAHGTDQQKNRQLEFGAQQMTLDFNEKGASEKITGEGEARLVTTADAGRTSLTSRRVDLTFAVNGNDSVLDRAFAQGGARAESRPPEKAVKPADTRVLSSEVIELKMRAGGEEIDRVETHAPAHVDLVPNRPGQRKRALDGERIYITYGAKNQAESLRAVKVTTRTEPDAAQPRNTAPAVTSSQDLLAAFAPDSGELTKLEQWTNFRYQEGARQATAERALLDQATNRIHLTGKSRVWDPAGATDADRILLDQNNGDFRAFGNVRTVRQGEKSGGPGGASGEAVRATADEMLTANRNRDITYTGRAVLWQGANRLTAQRIEIRREAQTLDAFGQVTSQLQDRNAKNGQAPVFTIVKAPEMHYSEKEKYAHYRGGALMNRPALQVKSQEIRAYLEEENTETQNELPSSGLEKAFATGSVEIVDRRADLLRQGWSEQAEYLVTNNKLTLEGGRPRMVDTQGGIPRRTATGNQLVWIAQDERLLVDGEEAKPGVSTMKRKKKSD